MTELHNFFNETMFATATKSNKMRSNRPAQCQQNTILNHCSMKEFSTIAFIHILKSKLTCQDKSVWQILHQWQKMSLHIQTQCAMNKCEWDLRAAAVKKISGNSLYLGLFLTQANI